MAPSSATATTGTGCCVSTRRGVISGGSALREAPGRRSGSPASIAEPQCSCAVVSTHSGLRFGAKSTETSGGGGSRDGPGFEHNAVNAEMRREIAPGHRATVERGRGCPLCDSAPPRERLPWPSGMTAWVSCGLGSPGPLGEQAHAVESDDDSGSLVPRHAQRQRKVAQEVPEDKSRDEGGRDSQVSDHDAAGAAR